MREPALITTYAWTLLIVVLALAALAFTLTHKWQRVEHTAGAALLASLLWPVLMYWLGLEFYENLDDPVRSSKASALAHAIAESMNLGVFGFPAWVLALVLWLRARRRPQGAS